MGFWVEDKDAERHEQQAIQDLEHRLHSKFPTVPDPLIDEIVEVHYHDLDANPVREYVPVLVEHAAVDDLARLSHR